MAQGPRASFGTVSGNLSLGDVDGRVRRLPEGMVAALGQQPDLFDLRALNRLASTFLDGHTSEDVTDVSKRLQEALGREETLCVVWAYRDQWGPAGDSETFLRAEDRLWYLPEALFDLLYDGRQLDRDDVLGVYAQLTNAPAGDIAMLVEVDRANLVREDRL